MKKIIKSRNFPVYVIFFLTMSCYLAFGFFRIGKSVTTDEHFWIYDRIPQYWKALETRKIKDTYINDKPGITVALVDSFSLVIAQNPKSHMIKDDPTLSAFHTDRTENLLKTFRLPIFFFNALMCIYLFWIFRFIMPDKWVALWASMLLLLLPFTLGISRVTNPDSLLWSLGAGAFFSYLALLKTRKWKLVFLTAIFTGLALLTKYVANILWIWFVIALFVDLLENFEKYGIDRKSFSLMLIQNIKFIAAIALGAVATFALLMPAALLKLKYLFSGTFGFPGIRPFVIPLVFLFLLLYADNKFLTDPFSYKFFSFISRHKKIFIRAVSAIAIFIVSLVIANWMSKNSIIDLSGVPIDARDTSDFTEEVSLSGKIIMEWFPFIFTLTPLVLFSIFAAWFFSFFKPNRLSAFTTTLTLCIVAFLLGGVASGVLLTPRYDSIIFPLATTIAATGLYALYYETSLKKNILPLIFSLILLILSLIPLWLSKPFYYSYASSLLPKEYTTNNTWGFGGYEAAGYLNSLPDAKNLIVWSDYRGTCEFFKGKCIIKYRFDQSTYPIDYYILTKRGQSKTADSLSNEFSKRGEKPVWELLIDGRSDNFIRVYKNTLP